jgi:hypothetical protein
MHSHVTVMAGLSVSFLLLISGCGDRAPVVLLEGERRTLTQDEEQSMRRHGREVRPGLWYDAKELDWIARDYARRQKIDFAFSRVDTQIWVPRSRDYLARVEYSSGVGKPVLSVTIGWDGSVVDHYKAIAVDEVTLSPNAGRPPDEH